MAILKSMQHSNFSVCDCCDVRTDVVVDGGYLAYLVALGKAGKLDLTLRLHGSHLLFSTPNILSKSRISYSYFTYKPFNLLYSLAWRV